MMLYTKPIEECEGEDSKSNSLEGSSITSGDVTSMGCTGSAPILLKSEAGQQPIVKQPRLPLAPISHNSLQQKQYDTGTTHEEEEDKQFQSLINQISAAKYDNNNKQPQKAKVSKDSFSSIKVIGTGSYGTVMLVKKKDTGKLYAMKVLKKKQIRLKKQVKNTWAERKILERICHPFIVKLNYAFHTDKKLFLVLDYCPGGELFFYISQIGRFKECSAQFYAANILLALECLHENGIIYRE